MNQIRFFKVAAIALLLVVGAFAARETITQANNDVQVISANVPTIASLRLINASIGTTLDLGFRTPQMSNLRPLDKSFHTPPMSNLRPLDKSFHTPPMSDYRPVDHTFHTPPMSDYNR